MKKSICGFMPLIRILAAANENMVITDPKGELYNREAVFLKSQGYNVRCLDFRAMDKDCFNVLRYAATVYRSGDKDKGLSLLSDIINALAEDQRHRAKDPFWPDTGALWLNGTGAIMMDAYPQIEQVNVLNWSDFNVRGSASIVEDHLLSTMPDNTVKAALKQCLSSAENTFKSILITASSFLMMFNQNPKLASMLSHSTFTFEDIIKPKTALFLVTDTWNATTVGYILNRREYLGHTVLGKTTRDNFKTKRKIIANEDELLVFYNTHEAIIDQETYDKAQRMRKRVSPRRNSEKPAHRLSGLLYCADCGSRLAYINSKPKDGKIYDSNQAFRCSRYHNKYHSCTGHYIKASTIEMLIYQATKRVSQYVLKDEKEFVEQLKAQYELQCEKDNTDDKKELLEAKRRMMDLDDLIKGLYENFTLGRLPERQFNRLMKEYDTEQSNLEQRISELETATERISTKAVQIDKFVRLVKKYRDFEELTTPMLNDFIEKVVIHEAEGGRTKDRTQQVDIYFNFIRNFVLPLSEDEVEALQSEEARRAEEIAERKRKSSKKSTQKRNQKRAEIKAKAEAGDPEAMAEYKAILEKGRQNNRKRSEKMRELRMSDPEYRAKMEEKERLALEREKKRQERATKKKKIALAELKEQAEKGNQEAVRELEERRAIARERSRKSSEKRKQRAENDPEYAKYLEERNAEYNRRHTARRKEQMEALRARAEAGDQEAQSQLAERKQYQVRATVKSYRKMREDALNGDPIAKVRYEKTLAMRREAYHAKKSEQTA